MDKALTITVAVLSSIVAGGGIGGLVSWLMSGRTIRHEREQFTKATDAAHRAWLLEKRYEAYAGMLDVAAKICVGWGVMSVSEHSRLVESFAIWRTKAFALSDETMCQIISDTSTRIAIPYMEVSDQTRPVAFTALQYLEQACSLVLRGKDVPPEAMDH